MCVNCGRIQARAKGRCNRCYKWWRKYGIERPTDVEDRRRIHKPRRLCIICAERPVHSRERCTRCVQYLSRTGREWTHKPPAPKAEQRPGWKGEAATDNTKRNRAQRRYPLTDCERCSRPGEVRHHRDEDPGNNEATNIEILCRRCHQRHHMGLPPRPCQHCGDLSKKLKRGRCNVCYQYLRVNGHDRPLRLIARTRSRRPVLQSGDPSSSACDGQTTYAVP